MIYPPKDSHESTAQIEKSDGAASRGNPSPARACLLDCCRLRGARLLCCICGYAKRLYAKSVADSGRPSRADGTGLCTDFRSLSLDWDHGWIAALRWRTTEGL